MFNCSDYQVQAPSGKIQGQLTDNNGFPLQAEVSIGQYPIIVTNAYGNFSVDARSFPFNLEVLGLSFTVEKTVLFKDVINLNPELTMPFENFTGNYSTCQINVLFPARQTNQRILGGFIASGHYRVRTTTFRDSLILFHVDIPWINSSINGKIILMVCTTDDEGNYIISYDNYGEKNITLNTGLNDTIRFTPSDLEYNPPESTLNFNIILPDSLWNNNITTSIYVNFPGYNPGSAINIYNGAYSDSRSLIIVPGALLTDFNLKVLNIINLPVLVNGTNQRKWTYTQPGTNVTVDNSEKISLYTPHNFEDSVNESTLFSFSGGNEKKGIYAVIIYWTSTYSLAILTDSTHFRLKGLNLRTFHLHKNSNYGWQVAKFSKFNSLNDFISRPFIDNEDFSSVALSPIWDFITSP